MTEIEATSIIEAVGEFVLMPDDELDALIDRLLASLPLTRQ